VTCDQFQSQGAESCRFLINSDASAETADL